jgi:hypothetical protein
MFITVSLFIGAMGKSAQIPLLHGYRMRWRVQLQFRVNSRCNDGYGWYLFSSKI